MPEPKPKLEEPKEKKGFFRRIKETVTKTSISEEKFDKIFWELEMALMENNIAIEFNTNLSMDRALILTRFQDVYGQGNGGVYYPNSEEGWGPKMKGQMVDHWSPDPNFAGPSQYAYLPHNNFEDFFQTGYNIANTLALTAGNDKVRSLFSYTNTISQGIMEHNKLRRNNFNLRIDGDLTNKFSFDTKLTYFNQRVDNRLASGGTPDNPMRAIYRQPTEKSRNRNTG